MVHNSALELGNALHLYLHGIIIGHFLKDALPPLLEIYRKALVLFFTKQEPFAARSPICSSLSPFGRWEGRAAFMAPCLHGASLLEDRMDIGRGVQGRGAGGPGSTK